eukprot:10012673-Alexandrium_andersonii.AAC.1
MEQCVEVYCQQFDVVKAQLPKRKVGTPFADDVKNTVLECGGHCTRCGAQCCSGHFIQLPKAEQASKASAPAGALFRPAAR